MIKEIYCVEYEGKMTIDGVKNISPRMVCFTKKEDADYVREMMADKVKPCTYVINLMEDSSDSLLRSIIITSWLD